MFVSKKEPCQFGALPGFLTCSVSALLLPDSDALGQGGGA